MSFRLRTGRQFVLAFVAGGAWSSACRHGEVAASAPMATFDSASRDAGVALAQREAGSPSVSDGAVLSVSDAGAPPHGADAIGDGFGTTGTGGGTTGLGEVGVGMNHAIGTASGYGTMGLRDDRIGRGGPPTTVRFGTPAIHGTMSAEVIRRIARRNVNQLRYCYEQGLAQNPRLAGRVVVQFVIGSAGAVTSVSVAESTLAIPAVAECVAHAFARWMFPAPEGGGIVIVRYPMELDPRPPR